MLWKIMGRLYVNNKRLAKKKKEENKKKHKKAKQNGKASVQKPKWSQQNQRMMIDLTGRSDTTRGEARRETQLHMAYIDDISER